MVVKAVAARVIASKESHDNGGQDTQRAETAS
jgi:hypothetical protein